MKVFLIGAGMGNPDTLTGAARHAVEDCEVLVGAERLIAPLASLNCDKLCLTKTAAIVSALAESSAATAAVLFSGDVGFYFFVYKGLVGYFVCSKIIGCHL